MQVSGRLDMQALQGTAEICTLVSYEKDHVHYKACNCKLSKQEKLSCLCSNHGISIVCITER